MTNYYENLDIILSQYRLDYLKLYDSGHYVGAAYKLFEKNAAHPPEAALTDMPQFVVRSDNPLVMLDIDEKAKNYCDYWGPRLEMAMSIFRKKNQDEYNRL